MVFFIKFLLCDSYREENNRIIFLFSFLQNLKNCKIFFDLFFKSCAIVENETGIICRFW